ncbi:MAG: translocation/assembly module TamB domain-containing protein, partial [Cyanobacteria bacterium P01_A01_bin.135]
LNGIVAFNLQRVEVETLNAKLNGGDIVITGDLPVFDPAQSGALQVTLDQVPIDLDVETAVDVAFSATVDGDLQVTGAATEPTLGGTVQIADGRVDPISGFIGGLGLLGGGSTDKAAPVPEEVSSDRPPQREIAGLEQFGVALERSTPDADSFASRIGFNDLRIILADDLEIAGQPFFNIEASGDLTVNGTLASLRPDGRLMLDSGWINIYTTQFRLDRGEPQVVILEPERGLDPILRVTAIADVPESQQTPVPPSSPFASSEVADQAAIPSFGGFETVEVTARIDGPLSQLSENLELESQPARTDSQLVALIGGGLVNQLAQGDTALALASYVGSGTFASFSNEVVDALGLDLFRIFPTTDVGGDSSLPISIGVEAGVDVTDDLSLTVLQLIGSTSPPQFGARYRLTDELQIRANTDLEEDTRGVLEYQIRF